ncbi:MAG: insulinase family protein [Actinobacteria bacterium]|uniref:Pitrilysin family protein n=1 Tax=Nostocoides veronense TaxID=330836 RepID=A0ABN2LFH9_9MICO|nr:insulinase family protein [Actinomycetota bacterium]
MTVIARPEVTPAARWAFPQPTTSSLSNGLTVHTFDLPGQYVVALRLIVPLSVRSEPRESEGVASLMTRLLDEGTLEHDTEEFTELLERKGVAFGAGLSDGGLHVDVDAPASRLADALALMVAAIARPSFPAEQVRRLVRTRLAEIEQERASAPHRAARELAATFFHPDERAARPTAGSAETVSGLTREDVESFHATHVGPAGATLIVSGDLSGIDLDTLLAESFGSWTPGPRALPPEAEVPRRADDAVRIVLVDRPDSVQSEIVVAGPGPDRHVKPAWAPYPVLGFVMGGSPNARVDAVLREEKGYTYGMRSGFRPRRAGGMFVTSGSVRTEVTADALTILLEILASGDAGFTAKELADGVDFIVDTAPGRFATADAVAEEAAASILDGLPLDFTTTNLDRMRTLTTADLEAAYARYVTGEWTIVIVGDASAYADAIRALGQRVDVVPN